MIINEENFKWHLEAFASEPFIYMSGVSVLMNALLTSISTLNHD